MKPLKAANDNVDLRTRQVWEPRLGSDLSPEDARQITANMTGVFGLLAKWAHAELPVPANDPSDGIAPDTSEARDDR